MQHASFYIIVFYEKEKLEASRHKEKCLLLAHRHDLADGAMTCFVGKLTPKNCDFSLAGLTIIKQQEEQM